MLQQAQVAILVACCLILRPNVQRRASNRGVVITMSFIVQLRLLLRVQSLSMRFKEKARTRVTVYMIRVVEQGHSPLLLFLIVDRGR